MARSGMKQRISERGPQFGCWIEMFSPIAAEVVAQAGYDFVLIDLEHGPGSYLDAIAVMQAIQGRDCAPLMRVPSNDEVALKRALDTGVAGVMVPAVNTADEAAAAVAACHYPPRGRRGMAAAIVRGADYGLRAAEYIQSAGEALLVMCQIESAEAVENAAAIAGTEGVDMLFIGPFDISVTSANPTIRRCVPPSPGLRRRPRRRVRAWARSRRRNAPPPNWSRPATN